MKSSASDITQLLKRWSEGDKDAADSLVVATYEEMRRLARGYLRRERRDHTLQPTALAHEAYLRLFHDQPVDLGSREAFFKLIALQMRRHLIDHARRQAADKRAGLKVNFDDVAGQVLAGPVHWRQNGLETLDAALARLAADHPRVAGVVQRKFLGGLSLEEVAAEIGVSLATVKRDVAFARAWLARELGQR